jgi:hypothetical protein
MYVGPRLSKVHTVFGLVEPRRVTFRLEVVKTTSREYNPSNRQSQVLIDGFIVGVPEGFRVWFQGWFRDLKPPRKTPWAELRKRCFCFPGALRRVLLMMILRVFHPRNPLWNAYCGPALCIQSTSSTASAPKTPLESPDVTRTDKSTGIQTIGSLSEADQSRTQLPISEIW